jgi:sugar phosphate isomerase/epimerase
MNTLAVNQLSTMRWTFEEDVVAYASRGFSGIGVWRPKLEDLGVAHAVELLAKHSLRVTSLSWAGGFTGSDGRGFDESLLDGVTAIQDAACLGAETLIVLAGGRNHHTRNHARRTLIDALGELVSVAEDFQVRLSIEPFHPGCGEEWSFVNDLRSTLDVLEALPSQHLGLVLDTYHLGLDDDFVRWLPDVVDRLSLVQLGDARHSPLGEMNRCLLGEGCVPVGSILTALVEAGFRGPMEVELLGEDVEFLSYGDLLDHAKAYIDRSMGLVEH